MQWGHGRWPCSTSVYIEKEHNIVTFPTRLTTPALVVLLLRAHTPSVHCTNYEFDVRVALHWACSPVPIVPACIPFRRSRPLQVPFVVLRNAEDTVDTHTDVRRRVFTDSDMTPSRVRSYAKYFFQNTHPLHFSAHAHAHRHRHRMDPQS
jgi:hypothetical protein